MKRNRLSVAQRSIMVLGGAAFGGMVGLLCAPATGARTRSLLRDKIVHYRKLASRQADTKSRHWKNRAQGMAHRVSKQFHRGTGGTPDLQAG